MKTLLKNEKLKLSVLSLVYLVLAVLFCVMPTKMYNVSESVLCFVLFAAGIICVGVYALMSVEDKNFKTLVIGLIMLALAVCMLAFPVSFGIILSVIIGFSGVSMIVSSIKLKKKGEQPWITDFVIGVVVTLLSVVTIVLSSIGSSVGKNILSIFFGIIFLINGIYSLICFIKLMKNKKKETIPLLIESEESEREFLPELVAEEKPSEVEDNSDNSQEVTESLAKESSSKPLKTIKIQKVRKDK